MKILHIGDIHLGCTLENMRRNREISRVFSAICSIVREHHVQAVLLAGDIFDNGSPSNESLELYYSFLGELLLSSCRQVIIIAGNHDSANFLSAPGGLLRRMNIHIVGKVDPDHLEDEVILLRENSGEPAAYVCAVPYLRERDLRAFVPEGESTLEETRKMKQALTEHYKEVFRIANDLRGDNKTLPVIGMGHLYASGSSFASGSENDGEQSDLLPVQVGTLDRVDLSAFAEGFSYMALGHLHKAQCVAGHESWRYAGSILPMTLQEHPVKPQVILLDTEKISTPESIFLPENCYHKMRVIRGDMAELRAGLSALRQSDQPVWVKPIYTGEEFLPDWALELRREFHSEQLQILAPEILRTKRRERDREILKEQKEASLARLTPEQLFLTHLEKKQEISSPEQKEALLTLFRSALAKVADSSVQKESSQKISEGSFMKFKRLFIRNVNSLYGDNLIDFEAEEFNSGIFLITGSTGAGKSSILDAICLALYGCTPRVSRISDTQNSVMSEGTDEMSCELTFSLGETLYRACFRHVRTRRAKKPFRTPEHKLYKDGLPADINGNKGIREEIIRLTGMNEAEFTRCVLLAQGSFDAFLKANTSERSEILKSITGTLIYTRIGLEINHSCSLAQNQYMITQNKLQDMTFLTDEEQEKLSLEKQQCTQSLRDLEEKILRCNSFEELFKNVEQSLQNVNCAQKAAEEAQKAFDDSGEKREELADANRAQTCQTVFDNCSAVRKSLAALKEDLSRLSHESAALEKLLAEKKQLLTARESSLQSFTENYAENHALFDRIRLLDHSIAEMTGLCTEGRNEIRKLREKHTKTLQDFEKERTLRDETQKKTLAASRYLETHADDALLEQKKSNWELRLSALNRTEVTLEEEKKTLCQLQNTLLQTEKMLQSGQSEVRSAEELLKGKSEQKSVLHKKLDCLLEGKDPEEIRLAWAAAEKLSDFFSGPLSRKEYLQNSEPCPLCGSRKHPYCEGTAVPEENRTFQKTASALKQRLQEINHTLNTLAVLEKEYASAELLLQEKTLKTEHLTAELHQALLRQEQLHSQRETALAEYEQTRQALLTEIGNSLQASLQDPDELFKLLEKRIGLFRRAEQAAASRTEAQQRFDHACAVFHALKDQEQALLQEKSEKLSLQEYELEQKRLERFSLFGNKIVQQESAALEEASKKIHQQLEEARKDAICTGEMVRNNQLNRERTVCSLQRQEEELSALEKELEGALQKAGFVSVDEFLLKRRPPEKIQELTIFLQKIDLELQKSRTLLAERQEILTNFSARIPRGLLRAENQIRLGELSAEAKSVRERLTTAEVELRQDQEKRSRHRETAAKLEEERNLFQNWKYLNDNFGSTPGANGADRFGRIAQGYTFRELLYFANANRLGSLQDHFTLINDSNDPLELNVIDHYRADQERTSRNLSGGESFEVSLALALGLAEMSGMSQNAKLGNVLLDEGFGTLDDNTLSSALDLLMQLKNTDGKLVGIISHVEKLKERIETRIEVSSCSGMGILSGAGVASREKLDHFLMENHPEEKKSSTGKSSRRKKDQ